MSVKTTEVEIEFNIFKTLKVIENDKVLDEMFREDNPNISYNLLHTMAKQDSLDSNLLDKAKEIFNRIITQNKRPLDEYLKIDDIKNEQKNKKKFPKYYGKKRIMEDIKSNNATSELDRAMLALNSLRNITARLRARGIKDKLAGTNVLSCNDCRDIIAAVRIVENKVSNILKNK